MATVELQIAPPSAEGAIDAMLQLYIHDFSEQWAGQARGELGEDGRFEGPEVSELWRKADHIPLLIRADGRLAGFCVLDRQARGARPVDRNVAEFFVVRKHRRSGVGSTAARSVFARYPGVWEVAVRRTNAGGLAFWPKVIAAQPGLTDLHELSDATTWDGPVFRFRME